MEKQMPVVEMRVSKGTRIKNIAGAIAGETGEGSMVALSCCGSNALYTAIKGVSMAEYMLNVGRDNAAERVVLMSHILVDDNNHKRIVMHIVPTEVMV